MDYLRKREGWARAVRKFNAAYPPAEQGLRVRTLTWEQRLQISANHERRAETAATRRNEKHADLVGREFGRLFAWKTVSLDGISPIWGCLCACGAVMEVAAHRLLSGDCSDCGCLQAEAQRVAHHRKTQKTKLRAIEARADRKRVLAVLKTRKRKPARKFWKAFGLAA
jgi:hypothetical protein